jgi:hypothetical protein
VWNGPKYHRGTLLPSDVEPESRQMFTSDEMNRVGVNCLARSTIGSWVDWTQVLLTRVDELWVAHAQY